MAVKIVNKLEAVEIHEDERKGAARAGRALPLRRECFHEKTMGFDAREAVRDGLLLGFLEGEGVVESASNEVSESAKQQNLFLGEFDGDRRLDIQYAVELFCVEHRESDGSQGIR